MATQPAQTDAAAVTGTLPPPVPFPTLPFSLPPTEYTQANGTWGSAPASVDVEPHFFGQTAYFASILDAEWNSLKSVKVATADWKGVYAPNVAFANYVEAKIDLHAAGSRPLAVLADGEKRGFVTTGAGSDEVVWVAHSNAPGALENTMAIYTGSGSDRVLVTAAGNSGLDDGVGHGPMWNSAYDGRFSTASVDAGAGTDTVLAQGLVKLRANGGLGNDEIRGAGGDDFIVGAQDDDRMAGGSGLDTFVLNRGDGDDWIEDFTPGADKLRLQGVGASLVATKEVGLGGTSGLLVTYDQLGSSVFLAGVAKLDTGDMVFA